jgi:fatty-acyl-CoA synthase
MLHADIVGERARLTPDAVALVEVASGRRFTYAELSRRARRCAAGLRALGIEPGDRVGLLAHNRIELLDVFLAAGSSGIVVVPIGTRLTAREVAHIVSDSGLRALVHDGDLAEVAGNLRELVEVEHWVALDEPEAHDLAYEAVLAEGDGFEWTPIRCDPEHPYCLLYTSGTTGAPKGVITPHRMVAFNGYNTVVSWQLRSDDVSPVFTPLYHAGGLGAFLIPIFTVGGTIVLHHQFDPDEVWRAIERERCTVVLGVPTIWKLLMETDSFATVDLASVRWLISGGAPLPQYIIEAYQQRGVVFKQGYGLTEVGVNCFAMTVDDSVRKRGSIGRPMMLTEACTVDADGRDVGPDVVGELCLRGPHVCAGYWQSPEATAAALDSEGWFHTGDLARYDDDGFFYIAGRSKDMLISGGVNIYPAEIEAELLQHPGVQDAAVVGVPHPTWGEVGVAFVVPRGASPPTAADLAAFLQPRLARYKIPKEVVVVDELPRTPYGKVVKPQLRERWVAEHGGEA